MYLPTVARCGGGVGERRAALMAAYFFIYSVYFQCLSLLEGVEVEERRAALMAAYGRLYLQMGNIKKADKV